MALKIYQLCGASGKVIVALAEKGDMGALQAYTGQSGGQLNYLQVGVVFWCTGSAVGGTGVGRGKYMGALQVYNGQSGGKLNSLEVCWCGILVLGPGGRWRAGGRGTSRAKIWAHCRHELGSQACKGVPAMSVWGGGVACTAF